MENNTLLNRVDAVTLDNIADFMCGDNSDKYPIYRSSFFLTRFFRDIDIDAEHDGSTRKRWVLSVLQDMSASDLEKIILRLVDIKIYKGDKQVWLKAIDSMDDILFLEDLKLHAEGKNVSIMTNVEAQELHTGDNFKKNIGITAGGSVKAGGDIVVNGNKVTTHTEAQQTESNLHKLFWKLIVPITVIVVAAGIVFWFDWS